MGTATTTAIDVGTATTTDIVHNHPSLYKESIEQYCGANVMFRKHVADGNEISCSKKISSWCVGTNGSWVPPQPPPLTLEQEDNN
jgi:hypothetical protein